MSKIADQAYQTIRDKIISGEYTAGSHLKEARIAEDTGASRTPVREALRRLNAEHLVRFEPNRGAYVNSWSLEDIEELYTLRSLLEGQAAYRAATRINSEQLATLVSAADKIDALIDRGVDINRREMIEANHEFHSTILDAAHSQRLIKILQSLVNIPITLSTFEKYTKREFQRSNHHHRDLIDAFSAGDAPWAQRVMENHLAAAMRLHLFERDEQ